MKTGTLHFKIGEGLSNLIRDAFWYEQRFDWARRTLECFEGLTGEYIDAILAGDACLKPIEDGRRVELVFEEDKEFKRGLAEHVVFVKEKIEALHKEVYQLDKIKDKMEYGYFQDETVARVRVLKSDKQSLILKAETFADLLVHYDELLGKKVLPDLTTDVGGYKIPNNLLDEYCNDVVRRIRTSLKTGMIIHENPLEMVNLEHRRQELHEKILVTIGFTKSKRRTQKYHNFAKALAEFLESMGAGLYDEEKK